VIDRVRLGGVPTPSRRTGSAPSAADDGRRSGGHLPAANRQESAPEASYDPLAARGQGPLQLLRGGGVSSARAAAAPLRPLGASSLGREHARLSREAGAPVRLPGGSS